MKRIFITGNAGAGKTTLSKRIGDILNREVISLDQIVWKPGWVMATSAERSTQIDALLKSDTWIIDGVSTDVLNAADTVIFLDYPRHISYWRVLKRNLRYLFKSRPGLPENCPEILIVNKLISLIWKFQTKVRPNILTNIEKNKNSKNIFHIRNSTDMNAFILMFNEKAFTP